MEPAPCVHALAIHRPGHPTERREVSGSLRVGGSRADDVQLEGAPPSAIRLVPCAGGVVVLAVACGVRVAGRPLSPGTRRLLRSGERAELHGAALVLELAAPRPGTRVAASALLRDAAAGAPPMAGAHLIVLSGPAAGARHPLLADQTLGRGRAATITIPDAHASRVHARIRVGPAGATVEDLGSKNGVRVNGVRIDRGLCPLRPGDELGVGETALALQDGEDLDRPQATGALARGRVRRRWRLCPAPHLLAAALLALSAAALALAAG